MTYNLFNQSNLEFLKSQPGNSIDSIVTDPPYGISFMGKSWDYDVPNVDTWKELMRVIKPGGHIIVACGTRTQHRMAVNIEDAGFEIRDIVAWVYGSGFPKSLNIGKAINKIDGVEFVSKPASGVGFMNNDKEDGYHPTINQLEQVGESSDRAKQWEGWGTALKPAMELWTLARKPLSEKTVAENVLKWGTGGINIDECRVGTSGGTEKIDTENCTKSLGKYVDGLNGGKVSQIDMGRFPANFIHDGSDEVVSMFPETKGGGSQNGSRKWKGEEGDGGYGGWAGKVSTDNYISRDNGKGSASRFFYTAKASKSERNAGLDGFEKVDFQIGDDRPSGGSWERRNMKKPEPRQNFHPTVKPVALMRYLTRLITPKGGVVLDPYMGSGSTGIACMQEGFNFIGVEMDKEYFEIAKARIEHWTKQ
jgi:site-specific DNA-methyltransferase (adenine-specific)